MAILRCERCRQNIVGPVGVDRCPWCLSPVTVVLEGSGVHDEERAVQRQQILLERLNGVLFGPGMHDQERVDKARQLMLSLAKITPNGNGSTP